MAALQLRSGYHIYKPGVNTNNKVKNFQLCLKINLPLILNNSDNNCSGTQNIEINL
jgi:hypothetical protein